MKQKLLSLLLAVVMAMSMCGFTEALPGQAGSRGFVAGSEEASCNHRHTEDCYQIITNCIHKHTDKCYPVVDSGKPNFPVDNETQGLKPTECTHTCSEENGCITRQLQCPHEHNAECGYYAGMLSLVPPANGMEYPVTTTAEFNTAVGTITSDSAPEATIVFAADNIDVAGFAGIAGKHVTLKSTEENTFEIANMGRSLIGDLTLDNVDTYKSSVDIFANGHLFKTTERFINPPAYDFSGSPRLYGGGKGTDVDGDTRLVLCGGKFSMIYGGGYNGDVSGSVSLTLEGDAADPNCHFGSVFGGGSATGTNYSKGCVGGDVRLDFISGTLGVLYGGGSNGTTSAKDHQETAAKVDGDIFITVGSAEKFDAPAPGSNLADPYNYEQGACLIAVDLYGGGKISSVGNVEITIENGAFLCEKTNLPHDIGYAQTKSLIGGGESDIVRGTVNITINGGLVGSVEAGGSTWTPYGIHSEVQNEDQEDYATHVVINGGVAEFVYPFGQTVDPPVGLRDEQIKGSTLIEFNDGLVHRFVLARSYTEIYGDSRLIVRGGATMGVPAVYGYDTFDHTDVKGITEVIFDGCGSVNGQGDDQFFEFTEIADVENVILTNNAKVSMPYLALGPGCPAFKSVTNLSVEAGSVLALDAPVELNGDLTLDGILAQSRVVMDGYDDIGLDPNETYPALVTVGGKATGTGSVLAMKAAKWLDEDTADNEAVPNRPVVGEIYINALKAGSTAEYTLKNEESDLYLKRINQPDHTDTRYAWQIASGYTVTYDKNGGDTDAFPNRTVLPITSEDDRPTVGTLPASPTWAGHSFKGWNTQADGKGQEFKADTPVTGSITVYAEWEMNAITPTTYTVTYDANGGSGTLQDVNSPYKEGAVVTVLANTFTYSGKSFAGWKDGEGKSYAVNSTFEMPSKDITLYAQWKPKGGGGGGGGGGTTVYYFYDLTFETNGGSPIPSISVAQYTTVQLTQDPLRDGYTFDGWYADKTLTEKSTSVYMDSDKTVYAKWTKNAVTSPVDPENPTPPSDPAEPGDPSEPVSPTEPGKPAKPDKLPQTSDASMAGFWLMMGILSGVGLVWINRRKCFY